MKTFTATFTFTCNNDMTEEKLMERIDNWLNVIPKEAFKQLYGEYDSTIIKITTEEVCNASV